MPAHCDPLMRSQFSRTRCALSLLVVLTLAATSACGTSDQPASTAHAQTQPPAAQSASSAGAGSGTEATEPARDHAAARPHPPVIRAGRTIRSYSGTGNHAIGSLSEKTAIVLEWNTSGQQIQLFTGQGFLILDSHSRAGRVRLAPGQYSGLHVASAARWTLLLRAAA